MSVINIGLDIGYGQLKGCNSDNKRITSESIVYELSRSELENAERVEFKDIDGSYCIGESALRQGVGDMPSPDSSYIRSHAYKVLGRFAVEKLCDGDKTSSINITTGLPAAYFNKENIRIITNGFKQLSEEGRVQRVNVITQPIGTLLDLTVGWNGEALNRDITNNKVAVIDIGYGTLDLIEVNAMRQNFSKNSGHQLGVGHAESWLYVKLMHDKSLKMGSDFQEKDMNKVLKSNIISVRGENKNVEKHVNEVKRDLARAVLVKINNNWTKGLSSLHAIVLTGGGASLIKDEFLKLYPKQYHSQIMTAEEPEMSNVIGFAKQLKMHS